MLRNGAGSQGDRGPLASPLPGAAQESGARGLLPSAGMALSSYTTPARPLLPGCPRSRALLSGVGGVEGRTSHSHGALPAMPGSHQKHQVSECIHYCSGRDRFEAG